MRALLPDYATRLSTHTTICIHSHKHLQRSNLADAPGAMVTRTPPTTPTIQGDFSPAATLELGYTGPSKVSIPKQQVRGTAAEELNEAGSATEPLPTPPSFPFGMARLDLWKRLRKKWSRSGGQKGEVRVSGLNGWVKDDESIQVNGQRVLFK